MSFLPMLSYLLSGVLAWSITVTSHIHNVLSTTGGSPGVGLKGGNS